MKVSRGRKASGKWGEKSSFFHMIVFALPSAGVTPEQEGTAEARDGTISVVSGLFQWEHTCIPGLGRVLLGDMIGQIASNTAPIGFCRDAPRWLQA